MVLLEEYIMIDGLFGCAGGAAAANDTGQGSKSVEHHLAPGHIGDVIVAFLDLVLGVLVPFGKMLIVGGIELELSLAPFGGLLDHLDARTQLVVLAIGFVEVDGTLGQGLELGNHDGDSAADGPGVAAVDGHGVGRQEVEAFPDAHGPPCSPGSQHPKVLHAGHTAVAWPWPVSRPRGPPRRLPNHPLAPHVLSPPCSLHGAAKSASSPPPLTSPPRGASLEPVLVTVDPGVLDEMPGRGELSRVL
ncbi:LOW QUALITY PROTEIN: hypothetical protein BDA96_10G020000 [Sorghum bicolor]|uniref:Uncharacterized protein n=1 Tax=Sorghum bicolor TaxID=4558 RepID=A0A921PYD7_SORBI|nr:LOW QUALITY PROTEIN: hypothetical protein BDA96_10G020000 [Sorghum bicolor]